MCQPDAARRVFCCTDPRQPVYDICGRLFSLDGFCHHRRTFDCHVLILVLEGTLHITAGGTARAVHAGGKMAFMSRKRRRPRPTCSLNMGMSPTPFGWPAVFSS